MGSTALSNLPPHSFPPCKTRQQSDEIRDYKSKKLSIVWPNYKKACTLAHTIMHHQVRGVRAQGRPKTYWLAIIKDWTGKATETFVREAMIKTNSGGQRSHYSALIFQGLRE